MPGLKPGLVEKFASARTPQEKPKPLMTLAMLLILRFSLLKAFIMDPTLETIEIEAQFVQCGA